MIGIVPGVPKPTSSRDGERTGEAGRLPKEQVRRGLRPSDHAPGPYRLARRRVMMAVGPLIAA